MSVTQKYAEASTMVITLYKKAEQYKYLGVVYITKSANNVLK